MYNENLSDQNQISLCRMERASDLLMSSSIIKLCYMCGHVGFKKERAWGKGGGQWLVGNGVVCFQI
jgi:hypothetical protein